MANHTHLCPSISIRLHSDSSELIAQGAGKSLWRYNKKKFFGGKNGWNRISIEKLKRSRKRRSSKHTNKELQKPKRNGKKNWMLTKCLKLLHLNIIAEYLAKEFRLENNEAGKLEATTTTKKTKIAKQLCIHFAITNNLREHLTKIRETYNDASKM